MKKILVVDDHEDILFAVKKVLESEYEVTSVASSKEFLERMNDPFELFIIDLTLPEIDGWQLCHEVREKLETPIIILTADTRDFSKRLAEKVYRAVDYIVKPISEERLREAVTAALRT